MTKKILTMKQRSAQEARLYQKTGVSGYIITRKDGTKWRVTRNGLVKVETPK